MTQPLRDSKELSDPRERFPIRVLAETTGVGTSTLRAIADFSAERLEAIFNEATSLHPLEMVTERLIEPTLVELASLRRSLDVPLMLGGPGSDQPLADFEDAGGVRLGSRISVAVKVLGTHVPLYASASGSDTGKRGFR